MVQAVTDQNFAKETKEGVVLIDFWATWCGPCRMQSPVLDELDQTIGDTVKIVKVDVDENPATAQQFGIMSIPTLIVKKDDQVVKTLVGYHSKEQLEDILADFTA